MTRPRASIVSALDTPYYHCINRCVRRAWLCGEDPLTGKSFEHRKPWMLARLKLLTEIFAIDLCDYALMSNHYFWWYASTQSGPSAMEVGQISCLLPRTHFLYNYMYN